MVDTSPDLRSCRIKDIVIFTNENVKSLETTEIKCALNGFVCNEYVDFTMILFLFLKIKIGHFVQIAGKWDTKRKNGISRPKAVILTPMRSCS